MYNTVIYVFKVWRSASITESWKLTWLIKQSLRSWSALYPGTVGQATLTAVLDDKFSILLRKTSSCSYRFSFAQGRLNDLNTARCFNIFPKDMPSPGCWKRRKLWNFVPWFSPNIDPDLEMPFPKSARSNIVELTRACPHLGSKSGVGSVAAALKLPLLLLFCFLGDILGQFVSRHWSEKYACDNAVVVCRAD